MGLDQQVDEGLICIPVGITKKDRAWRGIPGLFLLLFGHFDTQNEDENNSCWTKPLQM